MNWEYWAAFGALLWIIRLFVTTNLPLAGWGFSALAIALMVYEGVFYQGVRGSYPEFMLWVACATVFFVLRERSLR